MYPGVRQMNLSSVVFHMITDTPVSQPYKREQMTIRIFVHSPTSIDPKHEVRNMTLIYLYVFEIYYTNLIFFR
jgi:hypothetical protein